MENLLRLLFDARNETGDADYRTVAMTAGAMGITLAGAVAAYCVYVLNQLGITLNANQENEARSETDKDTTGVLEVDRQLLRDRSQLRTSGMIPILLGSLFTVSTLAINSILTALIVAQEPTLSRWWMPFSAGMVCFAVLTFFQPLARTFIADARSALIWSSKDMDSPKDSGGEKTQSFLGETRSLIVGVFVVGLGTNGMLVVANVLAAIPLIIAMLKYDKPLDNPYTIALFAPSVLASIVTSLFFEITGYRSLVRLSRERSGVMLFALSEDGRVLLVKKRTPPFTNQWTLPRERWELSRDKKSLTNTANRRANELNDRLVASTKIASGRKHRLFDLFHSMNVAGLPNIEIYELLERKMDAPKEDLAFTVSPELVPSDSHHTWVDLDKVAGMSGVATHVLDFLKGVSDAAAGRTPSMKYWIEEGEIGSLSMKTWRSRWKWIRQRS